MRAHCLLGALLVVVLAAGCTEKDEVTEEEMVARAAAAMGALADDVGPDGRVRGFDVRGNVTLEAAGPAPTMPKRVPAAAQVEFGNAGDVRIDGVLGGASWTVSCEPQRLAVVTTGLSVYSRPDHAFETRNPFRACTGLGAEPLRWPLDDAANVVTAFFVGDVDPLNLTSIGAERTGRTTFTVVFSHPGSKGPSDVSVHLDGHDLMSVTVARRDSVLEAVYDYGERESIAHVTDQPRFPGPVVGSGSSSAAGYEWTATRGSGGVVSDYTIRVYDGGDSPAAPCRGAPQPVVAFNLADGMVQSSGDWDLTFQDDGDGLLGAGDWALVQHPGRGNQVFDANVVIWDDWANASTSPSCSIPGPGLATAFVALAGAVAATRSRPRP